MDGGRNKGRNRYCTERHINSQLPPLSSGVIAAISKASAPRPFAELIFVSFYCNGRKGFENVIRTRGVSPRHIFVGGAMRAGEPTFIRVEHSRYFWSRLRVSARAYSAPDGGAPSARRFSLRSNERRRV